MERNFVVKKEFEVTLKSPRIKPHQTVASRMHQLLKRHSKPLASINKCVRKSMKLVVTIRLSDLKRKLKILKSMYVLSVQQKKGGVDKLSFRRNRYFSTL